MNIGMFLEVWGNWSWERKTHSSTGRICRGSQLSLGSNQKPWSYPCVTYLSKLIISIQKVQSKNVQDCTYCEQTKNDTVIRVRREWAVILRVSVPCDIMRFCNDMRVHIWDFTWAESKHQIMCQPQVNSHGDPWNTLQAQPLKMSMKLNALWVRIVSPISDPLETQMPLKTPRLAHSFIAVGLVKHFKRVCCQFPESDTEFDVYSLLKFEVHSFAKNFLIAPCKR